MDLSGAYRDVLVLVGTQTGNSERVAAAVAERLHEVGFTCHVVDMAEAYPEMLADYHQLVAVLCTWAEGTFPDNAKDFYAALAALKPPLPHLAYGLVGLGDRDYDPYFLTAADDLHAALTACGARSIVERHEIDGTPTPDDVAAAGAWALRCARAFAALHEAA